MNVIVPNNSVSRLFLCLYLCISPPDWKSRALTVQAANTSGIDRRSYTMLTYVLREKALLLSAHDPNIKEDFPERWGLAV